MTCAGARTKEGGLIDPWPFPEVRSHMERTFSQRPLATSDTSPPTPAEPTVDSGDLRSVIPNASTSAESRLLLSQLDATVFQFPTITSVIYRIDGSCQTFGEWLQLDGCLPRTPSTSSSPSMRRAACVLS
jgi:hypothetical protein